MLKLLDEHERAIGYQGKEGEQGPKPCKGQYRTIWGLPCHHRMLEKMESGDTLILSDIDPHWLIYSRKQVQALSKTYGMSTVIIDLNEEGGRPSNHPFPAPNRIINQSGGDEVWMNFNTNDGLEAVRDPPRREDRRGTQVDGPDIRIGAAKKNSTRNSVMSRKKPKKSVHSTQRVPSRFEHILAEAEAGNNSQGSTVPNATRNQPYRRPPRPTLDNIEVIYQPADLSIPPTVYPAVPSRMAAMPLPRSYMNPVPFSFQPVTNGWQRESKILYRNSCSITYYDNLTENPIPNFSSTFRGSPSVSQTGGNVYIGGTHY